MSVAITANQKYNKLKGVISGTKETAGAAEGNNTKHTKVRQRWASVDPILSFSIATGCFLNIARLLRVSSARSGRRKLHRDHGSNVLVILGISCVNPYIKLNPSFDINTYICLRSCLRPQRSLLRSPSSHTVSSSSSATSTSHRRTKRRVN